MPINSKNRDEVFVGRLRRDESQPNTLNMWIVADNLRKGAATNAVQIAGVYDREKPCILNLRYQRKSPDHRAFLLLGKIRFQNKY
jgi:hypothetical protein